MGARDPDRAVLPSDPAWLRIDLDEMARHGQRERRVRGTLPIAFLEAALAGTDAVVGEQAAVDLDLFLQPDGVVLVRGRMTGGFVVPCGRCLEDAAVDAGCEICVTFLPARSAAEVVRDEETLDLSAEDLDVYRYVPPIVDLAAVVREHWAVAYPMRALCARADACRGLCGRCGHPLNEASEDAVACPGCGGALSEVSQRPADRDRSGPGATVQAPWKQVLAHLAQDGASESEE